MKTFRKTIFCLLAFLVAFMPLVLAQGTYTQIDFPGATTTFCTGINLAGDVVGGYYANGVAHGFLLSGGIFTTLDYPGASYTAATGINDDGQIVGQYLSEVDGGFLYDEQTQTYTNIYHPGSSQTFATAINDTGTIVGGIVNQNGDGVGFELSGSTYRKILPQGFVISSVSGINDLGVALGVACSTACVSFEVNQQGQFQRIRIPAHGAIPIGLNDNNVIVGYHNGATTSGFIYQNGVVQSLTFPGGALATVAAGVNNAGIVSGYFNDASNVEHGFTWTP